MSCTLEVKCWEADYRKVLTSDYLTTLRHNNACDQSEFTVFINNVDDIGHAFSLATMARDRGDCTKVVIVKEYASAALKHFNLTEQDLGRGYVYSISELVSLYLCKTDYLVHFASDCVPLESTCWVSQAIKFLEDNQDVKVANLAWSISGAQAEMVSVRGDFYIGMGFSDQCYLVHVPTFRSDIYHEYNPASDRYPVHGGESFEKRVDSWMYNHGHLRATYRHSVYHHCCSRNVSSPKAARMSRRFRRGIGGK